MKLFLILLSSMLVQNFVFSRFYGICPFLGVSKKVDTAVGMGVAVTFVITIACCVTYLIYHLLLVKLSLEYLETIVFILVIAALVQFVEMVIAKVSQSLYNALGVYLPLITTNCAVLGVALINIEEGYTLIEAIVNGLGVSLGFTIAIVLFAAIRERMDESYVPESFRGFPIALISAGLVSLAFLGFQGML